MKTKIILIALAIIVGIPTLSFGGSLTTSLIQGKTPSEAVQILAEQIDSFLGRVDNLETQQNQTGEDISTAQYEIEQLKSENEGLRATHERENR